MGSQELIWIVRREEAAALVAQDALTDEANDTLPLESSL
jgi:hypothetical protein